MQIRVENVSKKFGRVWALEEITLELKSGQIVGILGANGAGKTTLLNCQRTVAGTTAKWTWYETDSRESKS